MGLSLGKTGKIDSGFENVFATGNLPGLADLGLQQSTGNIKMDQHHNILVNISYVSLGVSIMAENINRMRYMSHFRAVHRGAAFMDSRSSEVRQLKPDAWGFMCPVHTPDGSPCGLLNHLSSTCHVNDLYYSVSIHCFLFTFSYILP